MSVLEQVDVIRQEANEVLDPSKKGSLGQFFTAAPICLFMASLFDRISGQIKLLDPGCGPGSLTAAFTDELIKRKSADTVSVDALDIEERVVPFTNKTLSLCSAIAAKDGIDFDSNFLLTDFILESSKDFGSFSKHSNYTHCIMNPPYKKITTGSEHRHALKKCGIETVNLYTGFVALAIQKLLDGGELVAIIPRSFCNGPYY